MKLLTLLSPRRLALLLVALPMLLASLFYATMAADRYVSHTVISMRDVSGVSSSTGTSGLSSLLGGGGSSPAYSDLMYLQTYVYSMDMLKRLDQKLNLRAHYTSPSADFIFRLSTSATDEEFLEYFRNRVTMTHDDLAGLLTFDVQAFDKATAQRIAKAILDESERFTNDYMHRLARERMGFAESQTTETQARLEKAKADVLAFQVKNKWLDPMSQATANSSLTATLQNTLAQQEAALRAAQSFLSDDSFQVKTLRGQMEATKAQLEAERNRSVSPQNGGAQLASLTIEYQGLMTRASFAEEAYKAAIQTLEAARLDTMRKLKSLVVVEPPTVPDQALYPRRLYNLLTLLAVCGMVLTIVHLILATIREHQD